LDGSAPIAQLARSCVDLAVAEMRVGIADDQDLVRSGLRLVLEARVLEVVGEAPSPSRSWREVVAIATTKSEDLRATGRR
jgi:hypothetical protein